MWAYGGCCWGGGSTVIRGLPDSAGFTVAVSSRSCRRVSLMEDLLTLDRCRPSSGSYRLPLGFESVTTPLVWREWDRCLVNHPDQRFCRYIVEGIQSGFRVGFDYISACSSAPGNMVSVHDHPEVIAEYLAEECASGRVLGPLLQEALPTVQCSPFGVIPKGSSGKWRLILNLSAAVGL